MPEAHTAMAVTLATRVFEPESSAAAIRLGALVRALENAGNTVTVFTSKAPGARDSTTRVRRWPVLRDASGSVRGYLPYFSFDIPLFFRLLFGPRADVIVVEPPPTTGFVVRVASWLRNTPYVYFSADVLSSAVKGIGASRFVVAGVTWLERTAIRGASGVLTVSDDVKKQVISLGADGARVAMIGTGIDTEKFTATGAVAGSGAPYFIYAGTMSEVHGAGVFIEAFERIAASQPEVHLYVFGSGVEFNELAHRVKSLGDRATFSGVVNAVELAPWFRGAVAGLASVRPDRGYDFAFATKALASLSCGTPVIYAGVGPLGELIRKNNLGWATPWDVEAVATAMTDALAKPHTGQESRLAMWVEEHHSLQAVAASATDAIHEFVWKGRRHDAPG